MPLIPQSAEGTVYFDRKTRTHRWRCEKTKANGTPCGASLKISGTNVASHEKMHNPNSANSQRQVSLRWPIPCKECGGRLTNKNQMLKHYYRKHEHRGSQEKVFSKYGV
ncbi:hypothetical protein F5B20DRAFT_577024 [Whalleya microplaca]|nr:hypothetical protein F5B20DRAFT_577024 [Whalleya microplaca]